MTELSNGQRAFSEMLTKPGTVYVVEHGYPGVPLINAYRFTENLELQLHYTGRSGWSNCSYTNDWASFINHLGNKLKPLSADEASKLK